MDLLLLYVAVLMPMSRPPESKRGPPELPLLIEASVCIIGHLSGPYVLVSDCKTNIYLKDEHLI